MHTPVFILKNTFGYHQFLPTQQEVIDNVLAHRDTLAVMPTGGGKSLCYQVPALLQEGLTVVVSPLIALMKDQVDQLSAAGVPALFLNSTLGPEEYASNMQAVRNNEVKLLYLAPETLLTPRIFNLLDSVRIDLLTIDEAHCISEWGHDFRPEYRQLVGVRERYPQATCLALTATATPRVRTDIKSTLRFSNSNEFIASFDRKNLYIEVAPKKEPEKQALRFIQRFKDQAGIIYCFSRRQVDELAAYLAGKGFSALPYHAGMEDVDRRRNQEAFVRDDAQIIVATIAFGMGINKPNVRFILHYDLPKSIEGYYQEIGRAGRDGLPAHCLLLYSYGDVVKLNYFTNQKEGKERQVAIEHLNAIVRYAEDAYTCRRKPLLGYFGESYPPVGVSADAKCKNCDNCTSTPPLLVDITIPAQKFLSCVKRTGERFGAGYIIEVLRGSRSERVLEYKHDQLSTYGIGADWSAEQWMHLARQLVQREFVKQEGEKFRTLALTAKGLAALQNRKPIHGDLLEVEKTPKKGATAKEELQYNHALFAILRKTRKEIADAAGVPPYVIFSDRSLAEMATYYPQSAQSLLEINGVGQVKLEHYGERFLEVLRGYCKQHKLKEKAPTKSQVQEKKSQRHLLIGHAYNEGADIPVLMERYGLAASTVIDHLTRFTAEGNPLSRNAGLQSLVSASPDMQSAVFNAFDHFGTLYLKPVYEHMRGKVNYDELKVIRLLYLATNENRTG